MNEAVLGAAGLWALAGVDQPIILASSSPRRADILRAIGCPFEVVPPHLQEGDYGRWDGGILLAQRAVQKAAHVKGLRSDRAVLAADTIVLIGDQVLGKPRDAHQGRQMLQLLSGKTHEVWTALCYIRGEQRSGRTALCCTKVTFLSLELAEIEAYLRSGEPIDKAGAYGIQGIGGLWVQRVEGCYFNVVGLPVSQLWDLLRSR